MHCYILKNIHDIYTGLALEQFFFTKHSTQHNQDDIIVLFWQSRSAVVIGRNQNPFVECNLPYMRNHTIALARRDSGGGTVYHDEENVNICIISTINEQQIEKNLICLKRLLSHLGIDAHITKRHDLVIQDKKISGSAMRYKKQSLMHHFTVLLSPNISHIKQVLHAKYKKYMSVPHVTSVYSDITGTGLQYLQLTETFINHIEEFAAILSNTNTFGMNVLPQTHIHTIYNISLFLQRYALYPHETTLNNKLFDTERTRLASIQWIYQKSPSFTFTLDLMENIYNTTSSAKPSKTCIIHCKHGCILSVQDEHENTLYSPFDTQPNKNNSTHSKYNTLIVGIPITYESLLVESQCSQYAIIRLIAKKLLAILV